MIIDLYGQAFQRRIVTHPFYIINCTINHFKIEMISLWRYTNLISTYNWEIKYDLGITL